MLNLSSLSKEQLKNELRAIAHQCRSESEVKTRITKVAPRLAITVTYGGPMFMGMAMSPYHQGVVSF